MRAAARLPFLHENKLYRQTEAPFRVPFLVCSALFCNRGSECEGFALARSKSADSLLVLDGVIEMRTVRECTPRLQAGKRHIKILVRAPDGEVREIPEFHRHPAAVFRAADGRAADGQSLGHYRIGGKKLTRNMQPAAVERQTDALCGQHNALVGNNTRQRVRSLELDEIIRDFLVLLPAQRIGIVTADLIIHRAAAVVARDVLLEERAAVEREAKRTGEVPRIHFFGILALRERKFRTGAPQDANSILIPKPIADEAMDAASCIGCGACVAACKNGSAMLFVSAKVSQLNLLPQGKPEALRRAKAMLSKMDELGFGNCTNTRACEAECPKCVSISNIARLNRDFIKAKLKD